MAEKTSGAKPGPTTEPGATDTPRPGALRSARGRAVLNQLGVKPEDLRRDEVSGALRLRGLLIWLPGMSDEDCRRRTEAALALAH